MSNALPARVHEFFMSFPMKSSNIAQPKTSKNRAMPRNEASPRRDGLGSWDSHRDHYRRVQPARCMPLDSHRSRRDLPGSGKIESALRTISCKATWKTHDLKRIPAIAKRRRRTSRLNNPVPVHRRATPVRARDRSFMRVRRRRFNPCRRASRRRDGCADTRFRRRWRLRGCRRW